MATTISHGEKNSGFQAGVINGNIGNITIVQSETLNQECLRDLRTTDPLDDKERIKNSKGGLLKDAYRWILDNKEFRQWQDGQKDRLLWIRGDPGKGKTMLLCGVTEELTRLYGDNANILFFFCQATDPRINSATSVLRGLIYSLVKKHPSLLPYVRARYDHAGKALFEDVNAWNVLSTIFKDMLKDPTLQMTYLMIDALDECINGLDSLLDLIIQESSANLQIKWVVSSRNWPEITERLHIVTQLAPVSLELNEVSVSEAVNQFIQHKVQELAKAKKYSNKTRDAVQRYLLSNSQGTFLWVALVCQNLEKIRINVLKKLESFPPGLNTLYRRMIDQVRESEDAELCKEILAIMSTVFRPITLHELTSLIELPGDGDDDHIPLEEIIAICGSFLTLREHTVVFVHQSAKEFLLKEALSEILPGGIEAQHNMICARSLDVIFKTLQRDLFKIKLPGLPAKDICKPSPNPLAAAEYACVFWVDHLQGSKRNKSYDLGLNDRGPVDVFLQQKYLHWLEALSVLGSVSNGIRAMQKLEVLVQSVSTLEGHSVEVFCITWSPDGRQLTSVSWDTTVKVWDIATSQSMSTLEGPTDMIFSIVWSPDRRYIASSSNDRIVIIWDPATGQRVSTLKGHSNWVNSIAWSPDGSLLASASSDRTVRVWDPATSQSLSTLRGHSDSVNLIAWSPDGTRLASASNDNTVGIWDPATGQSMSSLRGHSDSVNLIAWSPDGTRLASASNDNTVGIWDPATGQSMSSLRGHSDSVNSIAWSPDGRRLASASDDGIVKIWDPATGQSASTLDGHSAKVFSIAWSPDGRLLASASGDMTVRVWDPVTSQSVSTREGPSHGIKLIAWSPDGTQLASTSNDNTVRIWDPANGKGTLTLEGHSCGINSIAWSPDGARLASTSNDNTVRIWDPATAQSVSTLEGHSAEVFQIVWSPDGTQLASTSNDNTVRIWDPATGQSISTLKVDSYYISSIAWSPDGSLLATASVYMTVQVWDPVTNLSVSTRDGHSLGITSIAWSPDGIRLASASNDYTVGIWDSTTGQSILNLEGHSRAIKAIAWSPDGTRLASASHDNTVRIWDPATGQSMSTLYITSRGFLDFDKFNPNHLHTSLDNMDMV
ncbi:hypothetical protein N7509_004010 [Penicillium cosmopolitanum]|uniref:Mitochondrial division protein 1 n=1 Tax=Penicillium cosmopolitanum TaxID=1131564 RepID=A0A9W9W614_9EURO|nr:uncharacterized protein N7509_004010 [Penicillium cosmopolitanum]KAJ5404139.1 hypothetical protein N7509_004010 [Penicillium cosmopolitanum]